MMKYKKQIPIFLLSLATIFSANSASAQTLMPSLYDRMEKQTRVDIQYEVDKINMQNEARLFEIRQRNQARLQGIAYNENEGTFYSASNAPKKAERKIDSVAREQALSRPVYRRNTSNFSTPTRQYQNPKNTGPTHTETYSSQYHSPNDARDGMNIDMNRVEQTWLGWNNALRHEAELVPYTIHPRLNETAQEWSDYSKNRGYITHGRPGDGCIGETNYHCYNFRAIDKWFRDRNINPKIIKRAKHTENLGIGSIRCKSNDCTDAAINAIRKTYNFFYSEKPYNGSHYRSMMQPDFRKIGVGLSIKNGTYYLTVHYVTDM